jgi:hypothetical protein
MNKICFNKSMDGSGIKVGNNYEDKNYLIDKNKIIEMTERFKLFKSLLIEKIYKQKEVTSNEINYFTIMEDFRPMHAKKIILDLIDMGKIKVYDSAGNETKQMNLCEEPKGISIFKFID